ncbi:MAG TPA: bifunctional pyr operon transcriptional regulator/uracil phosphoribosyltransferase PyrR [Gammaproteobacteria bacterium]|nr:bifunctional pyr operon transcriptional regulator/uracil phosphoribosyltransferase PyrR [Gammaproteobacteria bacterium]
MQKIATPDELLAQLAKQTKTLLENRAIDNPLMVGIQTGGVWVATELHQQLNISEPLATLDISFYRDDFSRIGMNPKVKPSSLPPEIEDRHIILVDDVLHTGRTIRAAMNELFDYGRPASINLICLIDRSGRELPLQADIVGKHIELEEGEHIKLTGPQPLAFELQKSTGD